MKKMYYLVLSLFIIGTTSVSSQVTIGSNDDPHPAAVLDLKSSSLGILLPQVEIVNLSFFGFSGNKAEAEGMLAYNPGTYLEKGLYLWDGGKWILLISTAASLKSTQEEISQAKSATDK